jgi:type IV pilus assembly protein PilY1
MLQHNPTSQVKPNPLLSASRRLALALAVAAYAACGALVSAAPLNISDTPLFLTGGVKPNLIMAIDDSGSMDFEVLLPGNDGSAWWRTDNSASGGCPNNIGDGSFVGCVADGTTDLQVAGKLNFNNAGTSSATWKKFVYLFPNGDAGGSHSSDRRRLPDFTNDHYAVPPIGSFGWARSSEFNSAYFDPTTQYTTWVSDPGYPAVPFADAIATAAEYDPVFGGAGTMNLTRDVAGITSVDVTEDCEDDLNGAVVSGNFYFRVFTGMVLPHGTCVRTSGIWNGDTNWVRVQPAGCVVGAVNSCPVDNDGSIETRTLNNNTSVAIRYFPATFYASASNAPPATFGYSATPVADGVAPDGSVLNRYEIKSGNFVNAAAYTAAIQNFANWFTYYRKRHLSLRAGLGKSFQSVTNMFVAGFTINQAATNGSAPDVTMGNIDSAAFRTALYTNFYANWVRSGGTPNRSAVANLVRNFKRTGGSAPVIASCQRNFGMLFTDGFSNQPTGDGITTTNVDASEGVPRADTFAGSMADHVLSAYNTTIRPDLTQNLVQVPAACADGTADPWLDCNNDPHMNFYAITLGTRGIRFNPDVTGVETPAFPYSATTPAGWTGAWPITWPTTFPARNPAAVDDIWHATINGRGQLLNAKRPTELADKLSAVLKSVVDSEGSAASAAVSSGTVSDSVSNRAFSVSFDSKNWSGTLRAFELKKEGDLINPVYATVPAPNSREIFTVDSSGDAIPFRWADISADVTRRNQLHPTDVTKAQQYLEYLRGDRTNELPAAAALRKRVSGDTHPGDDVLGDIVDSAPVFVGAPPFRIRDTLEADAYSVFQQDPTYKDRTRMIYVGANDGMLHAFKTTDAVNGPVEEAFAYIPGPVFKNLSKLVLPTYTHTYYVNGTVSMTDAYYRKRGVGPRKWRTVLAAGLNKGGQGIYVLDVTEPDLINESTAGDALEWEFTDADDADLGYTYSRPAVVRAHDGKWYVIFGNGYHSTDSAGGTDTQIGSGKAALFIVELDSGNLKKKILLPPGTLLNPNGLSTPAVVDPDGDDIVDYVYAGDLLGNMWKFDISSADPNDWDVLRDGGVPKPLFEAKDSSAVAQPITTRPQVGRGPLGAGMVVLFGTGRFLEVSDRVPALLTPQTFYGVHDSGLTVAALPLDRGDLTEQTILDESTVAGKPVRVTSTNSVTVGMKGWYMDLMAPGVPANGEGEMQVSDPVLRSGRIAFATLIPNPDPCSYGGRSWFMLLDALSGARVVGSSFDVDGNKTFGSEDMADLSGTDVLVSGIGSTDGIMSQPRFVASPAGDLGLVTDTKNQTFAFLIDPGAGRLGRQSWRQLR